MQDTADHHKKHSPYDRISRVFGRQVLQEDAMSVLILHRSGYAPCKMNRPKLKEID
jgi:hypothetical protein